QREADRSIGHHVGTAHHPRQLHHDRRAGAVVVRGFAPADAVHVPGDDVHLLRVGGADLGAEDVLARTGLRRGRLGVQLAQLRIGLGLNAVVDRLARLAAADAAAALPLRRIGLPAAAAGGAALPGPRAARTR